MDNTKIITNTLIILFVCFILFLILFLIYFFLNKSPNNTIDKTNNYTINKSTNNTIDKTTNYTIEKISRITFMRYNNGNGIFSISQIIIYDEFENIIEPLKIVSSNNKSSNKILNEMIMFNETLNISKPPNNNKIDFIEILIPPSIIKKLTIHINKDINLNNIGNCAVLFRNNGRKVTNHTLIYHLSHIQTYYNEQIMTKYLQIYGNDEVFISRITIYDINNNIVKPNKYISVPIGNDTLPPTSLFDETIDIRKYPNVYHGKPEGTKMVNILDMELIEPTMIKKIIFYNCNDDMCKVNRNRNSPIYFALRDDLYNINYCGEYKYYENIFTIDF